MIYAISFRIKSDSNWEERWQSLVARARTIGGGIGAIWEETTSFFLLSSNLGTDALATDLYLNSLFDASRDKLLVVNLSNNSQASKGMFDYPNTLSFLLSSR